MITAKVTYHGQVFYYRCDNAAGYEMLRDAFIPMGATVEKL